MAIEIQVEKMRAAEATSARDSAVQRLASAYDSIKEKVQAITRLTSEKAALEVKLSQTEKRATEAEERLKLPVPVVATTGPLQFGSDTLQRFNERENLKREVERLNVEVMMLKGELERTKAANSDRNGPSQHILANVDVYVISPSPTLILDVGAVQDSAIDAISNNIDRMGIGQRPHSVAAFRASTLSSVSYPSTCSSPALKLPGEGFPPLNDYRVFIYLILVVVQRKQIVDVFIFTRRPQSHQSHVKWLKLEALFWRLSQFPKVYRMMC